MTEFHPTTPLRQEQQLTGHSAVSARAHKKGPALSLHTKKYHHAFLAKDLQTFADNEISLPFEHLTY